MLLSWARLGVLARTQREGDAAGAGVVGLARDFGPLAGRAVVVVDDAAAGQVAVRHLHAGEAAGGGHGHVEVGVGGRRRGGRFRVGAVLGHGHRARPAGGGAEVARRAGPAPADRGRGGAANARAGGKGTGGDGALRRENVEGLRARTSHRRARR